jgi:hypothetical protein
MPSNIQKAPKIITEMQKRFFKHPILIGILPPHLGQLSAVGATAARQTGHRMIFACRNSSAVGMVKGSEHIMQRYRFPKCSSFIL